MNVYFAQRASGGPIKIGYTGSLQTRIYELGISLNENLTLLAHIAGTHADEAKFHAHFERFHVGREWFEPAPELLSVIAAIVDGSFDKAVLPERGWCVTKPYRTKASITAEANRAAA